MMTEAEEWRAITEPGFEGIYEVSSIGRVRRITDGGKYKAGRIFVGGHDSSGYPHVLLSNGKRVVTRKVHRLVAAAFLGPIPAGKQVNHKDRNRQNPRIENLEYVTPQENSIHGYLSPERKAAQPRGLKHHNCKLTEAAVRDIKRKRMTITASAVKYGISTVTVKHIRAGRAWAHVS